MKGRSDRHTAVRSAGIRYRFGDDNFDFWFQWLLGSQTHGGSECGECFYAASRVRDGDAGSWLLQWTELGARLEERAFEDTALPAYFLCPDRTASRRQTLIMVGGGDTFVEDLYFYVGPAAVKRGYNVLMVDLPGQCGLPFAGLPMRPDAEVPMRAVMPSVPTSAS